MSTNYIATGVVTSISKELTFGSDFTKKELVIKTDGQYPQVLKFDFNKNLAELLNPVTVGDTVNVTFSMRGKEYNGRYYTDLVGYRIDGGSGGSGTPITQKNDITDNAYDDDDLPF